MGNNKQKITYETIKYISTHKLEQMLKSYQDLLKKKGITIFGLPYRLSCKIRLIKDEINLRYVKEYLDKEQKNDNE